MSGRKVELYEETVPSLNLESRTSEKSIPMMPTSTREEANDDDHETSDQVNYYRTLWYGNPDLDFCH